MKKIYKITKEEYELISALNNVILKLDLNIDIIHCFILKNQYLAILED